MFKTFGFLSFGFVSPACNAMRSIAGRDFARLQRLMRSICGQGFRASNFLFICLFAYLFIFRASLVRAQEKSISISPPTESANLFPGESVRGTIKVENGSSEAVAFTTSIQDYIVSDQNNTPVFLPFNSGPQKFSASSWIEITPNVFTIEPGDKKILDYTIYAPKDAAPGGHYAGIILKPGNGFKTQTNTTAVNIQLAVLFYITIKGQIKEKSSVIKFTGSAFQEYGPVKITTQIQNLGDLHIKPRGEIQIYDIFGNLVEKKQIEEFNIFPLASRDYETIAGKEKMAGYFKAVLKASSGFNNESKLVSTFYFWVIPWKEIVRLCLIGIALVLLLRRSRTNFGRS